MITEPLVYGMAATDIYGAICYCSDGVNQRLIGELADGASSNLDKSILIRFIETMQWSDVAVVGENTFHQMSTMFGKTRVLVSDKEGTTVWIEGVKVAPHQPYDKRLCKKKQLITRAYELALDVSNGPSTSANIYVFGGKTVYEAFAGLYNEFYHCTFEFTIENKFPTKTIRVRSHTGVHTDPILVLGTSTRTQQIVRTGLYSLIKLSEETT